MNNKIGKAYSRLGELINDLEEALLESKEKNRALCGELADSELNIENQALREEVSRLQKLNDGLRSQLARVTTERDQLIHTVTTPVVYTTPSAVDILDEFTKSWCVDKEETLAKNDLCFRCKKCEFSTEDGYCLVKKFAKDKDPERKDFGAMS